MHIISQKSKKNDKSYFFTLLLFFLITSIVSTLLLTIFLTINYFNSMSESIKRANQQLLSQTNYAIDQMHEDVTRLTTSCLSNDNILSYLYYQDMESTIPVLSGRDIGRQLMLLPNVESIYLYSASTGYTYSSKTGFQVPLAQFEDVETAARLADMDFLSSTSSHPVSNYKSSSTEDSRILSYYFPNIRFDTLQNVIVVNVYASSLTDSISAMKQLTTDTESSFVILDENRTYITGILDKNVEDRTTWLSSALDTISVQETLESSLVKINGKYYFQVCTDDNIYGWYLMNYMPISTILRDIISSTLMGLLLFFCVLCISIFLCVYFSRRLNTPVETLAHALNEKRAFPQAQSLTAPKEFQKILSAVSSLQENNRQLRSLQQKTKYSQTQDCLNSLIANHNLDSPDLMSQKLERLGLTWLEKEKICMAVLKIDNYQQFLTRQNPDELWVIRFSVINIVEELASASFTCNAFSRADDKFVLLLAIHSDNDKVFLEEDLISLFHSIQENLETYLHFTVSIAYSTFFQGIRNLPTVFSNVENSLYLKMHYGHNCIIDPYQTEDMQDEAFQLSYRGILQMTDRLINGQADAAWSVYQELTAQLLLYNYNEIMSTIIHMIYSVYERLTEKYPMLKDFITQDLKNILVDLEHAEIIDDIHQLMHNYFENLCTAVLKLKNNPAQQGSAIVADKITQIIQEQYTNPTLCLCSIADQIGLSSNYTGHVFKQHTAKSVSAYILEVRMEKVAHYLQTTSWPIGKILDMVGLEKNNYFYTRFKNYFGMSLSEYKQKFQLSNSEDE
ncbi:MAG: AraC family transcriptional regulator [Oliverpabstia sp.]